MYEMWAAGRKEAQGKQIRLPFYTGAPHTSLSTPRSPSAAATPHPREVPCTSPCGYSLYIVSPAAFTISPSQPASRWPFLGEAHGQYLMCGHRAGVMTLPSLQNKEGQALSQGHMEPK